MISVAARAGYKTFAFPQLIAARFTARQTTKLAVIWGVVFGLSSLSSITGFNSLYKTPKAKLGLVQSFGHNAGLNALFGVPDKIDTAGGFTVWRMLGLAMLIGSIWGLLTAAKTFRGQEEAGRWELFLCGQSTARRATAAAFAGLMTALAPVIIIPALLVLAVGHTGGLHYGLAQTLFYGLALSASAALFMSVGVLMSQLAPIRRQAATYSALIFGICFLLRAAADSADSLRWLRDFSPLGWVENLRPITGSDPIWLIPITLFIAIFSCAAIYLAGRRDLGASLLADRDSAKPRTRLLRSPLGLSVRLERNSVIGWVLGAGFVGLLYGYISKSAVSVLKDSAGANKAISKLAGASQMRGVETYMGVVFLLLMIAIMVQATNLVGAIRSEEAEGHLDNLVVQPIARLRWLGGRLLIVSSALIIAAALGTLLAWAAIKVQNVALPFSAMLKAGLNILPADIFVMGVGLLALGFRPRLTSTAMYAVIAWSFLLEMVGSAINLNHYILDSSVIHHVALAPAADPRWTGDLVLLLSGLVMLALGVIRFNGRDLQNE